MENLEFFKRIEDLADRCERTGSVTCSGFLTPAEQYALQSRHFGDATMLLHGGGEGCERKCAFFLPWYLSPEDFDAAEYIRAVKVTAYFGEPCHRDYMGAALGLGIKREWVGDLRVMGTECYIFCLPSVEPVLLELEQVGRCGVKTASLPLSAVPVPERKVKRVTFTVKSLRLDAVVGGMFSLSRTAAADLIRMGAATLNYSECDKVDAPVKEGDVISLKGHGKGTLSEQGGRSRKDRIFLTAEINI